MVQLLVVKLIEKASITILADPIQDIQSSTATVSLQKQ